MLYILDLLNKIGQVELKNSDSDATAFHLSREKSWIS